MSLEQQKPCEKGNVARIVDRLSKDYGALSMAKNVPLRNKVTNNSILAESSGTGIVGSTVVPGANANGTIETAIVRYSYSARLPDELDIKEGDEILVLEHAEDGWAKGEIIQSPSHPASKGKIGLYPTNFVSTAVTDPTSIQTPAPQYAKVLYKYEASNSDELSLAEGVVVLVVTKQCDDEGWFVAEFEGQRGLFPDNFVKFLPTDQSPANTLQHSSLNVQPPSLPAKPQKFGGTGSQQPVASARDSLTTLMSSTVSTPETPSAMIPNTIVPELPQKKTALTTTIGGGPTNPLDLGLGNSIGNVNANATNINIRASASAGINSSSVAGNRRSMIADLQSKLTKQLDGRPLPYGAAPLQQKGGKSPVEQSVEPKMEILSDGAVHEQQEQPKLVESSIVKSRVKIAPNKRPPSKVNSAAILASGGLANNNTAIIGSARGRISSSPSPSPTRIKEEPPSHSLSLGNGNQPTVFSSLTPASQMDEPQNHAVQLPSQQQPLLCTVDEHTSAFTTLAVHKSPHSILQPTTQLKAAGFFASLSPSSSSAASSSAAITEQSLGTAVSPIAATAGILAPSVMSSSSATASSMVSRAEFEHFRNECQRNFAAMRSEIEELRQRLDTAQNKLHSVRLRVRQSLLFSSPSSSFSSSYPSRLRRLSNMSTSTNSISRGIAELFGIQSRRTTPD